MKIFIRFVLVTIIFMPLLPFFLLVEWLFLSKTMEEANMEIVRFINSMYTRGL